MNCAYIVIGSGPSGAMAAQTLVEAGVNTVMLDVGITDNYYKNIIPDKNFIDIRTNEKNQHEYFLGKNYEGINWGKMTVGSQLTPPRKFITENVEKLIPLESNSFTPMESLAYGGLGSGWGTGCHCFSDYDLSEIGLNSTDIKNAYEIISKRIIISGEMDDAAPYSLGNIKTFQPATQLEEYGKILLNKYQKNKNIFNSKGFYLGRMAQAHLTQDVNERKKTSYNDMEFWTDAGKSAYRPWMTIDELRKKNNFSYQNNCLVLRFEESDNGVKVFVKRTDTNENQIFYCRKLILASGVLGTARIVLRSSGLLNRQLPIISNSYCYIPCIQWRMLGKELPKMKISFGQLGMFYDEKGDNSETGMAAFYNYRSLLLFKLIKEVPFDFAGARILMQFLQSSLVIVGIHHPERSSENKFIQLVENENSFTGDKLTAQYRLSDSEKNFIQLREKKYKWALSKLGCIPLKTIYPGHGASIHYAGTLPFSKEHKNFAISPEGKLWGTKNIFIADGSGFRYLPAKGLTFTLMANAHCVAQNSLKINE